MVVGRVKDGDGKGSRVSTRARDEKKQVKQQVSSGSGGECGG